MPEDDAGDPGGVGAEGDSARAGVAEQDAEGRRRSFDRRIALCALVIAVGSLVATFVQTRVAHEADSRARARSDRPVVLASGDVSVQVRDSGGEFTIAYVVTLVNLGSGNAYNVKCYEAEQVPAMYTSAVTKADVFSSLELCAETFTERIGEEEQAVAIGTGLSVVMTTTDRLAKGPGGALNRHKKYIAVFFESETGRRNASVVGLAIEFDRAATRLPVEVEDLTVVADPRVDS
ncbi:MAG: hypothetical protein GY783_17665 [Gammaproteobacteria bacterium]|nr:hypothetical protein [Gammaproteobacteria bacterium]